jgi:hypothetical protein
LASANSPDCAAARAAIREWADARCLDLIEDGTGGAVFSPCRRWRYLLWRIDSPRGGLLGMGLLNPSTADASHDDPTIRRCRAQIRRARLSGLVVWNLFAFRATLPADLRRADDPVGPDNDAAIALSLHLARRTILGWGAHGSHRGRDAEVLARCQGSDGMPYALGFTDGGAPRHPLYLRADARCRRLPPKR